MDTQSEMPNSAGDAVSGHLPSVGQWDLESTQREQADEPGTRGTAFSEIQENGARCVTMGQTAST